MAFTDVFSGHAGLVTGGGVTPGQEPWNAPTPPTTITISREPKPLILYAGINDPAQAAAFLEAMAGIMARISTGEVRPGTGVVEQQFGIRYLPNFGKFDFGRLSIALENAGFDPTKCALQPYDAVTTGSTSGIVKYHGPGQLVVRLVHGAQVYEGVHDTALCLNSPMVFAMEIETFMRL